MTSKPGQNRLLYSRMAGFVAMACIGWVAGGGTRKQEIAQAVTAVEHKSERTRTVRDRSLYRVPEYASAHVRAIREAGSTVDQMRATIALVNALPTADLEKWMEGRWFDDAEGFNLTLFNKVATEHWMKNDPVGYLAWSAKNASSKGYEIARSWAKNDPEGALAYIREHPNPSLEIGMLTEIAKSRPALALERIQAMASESSIAPSQIAEIFRSLAGMGEAALQAAMANLPDQWHLGAKTAIQEGKLLKSFSGSLKDLMNDADSARIFSSINWGNPELCSQLLSNIELLNEASRGRIANNPYQFLNAENAESWITADLTAKGFTDEQTNRIRLQAISELPSEKALYALNRIADDPSVYESALRNILSRHKSDLKSLERFSQMLTDDADKQIALGFIESAREAVQVKTGEADANAGQLKASRDDKSRTIIDQALAMSNDKSGGSSFELVKQIRDMSNAQKEDFIEKYKGLAEEQKTAFAASVIEYSEYGGFPDAVRSDMIVSLLDSKDTKIARNAVAYGSSYAVDLLKNNPADATTWVAKLRDGESKIWVQKNIACNWALYEPDAAQRWVQTLPSSSRAEVQAALDGKGGSHSDP